MDDELPPGDPAGPPASVVLTDQQHEPLELLFLPDSGDRGPTETAYSPLLALPAPVASRCPPEMVDIRGAFCIDRYEAVLIDETSGQRLSPYYPPAPGEARRAFERWRQEAGAGRTDLARQMPVPVPPAWQLQGGFTPVACARPGVVPNGYSSQVAARRACENAGKRLCTEAEWVTACRGEAGTRFPYGDDYEEGRCNVFRAAHPASLLHANASVNHTDPRLNQVKDRGEPLLRPTGATPGCRSVWGEDAVYDLVGNLDEWIDDPSGVFLGGFYSRGTKEGCLARVSAHDPPYYDYSLGVRCCR